MNVIKDICLHPLIIEAALADPELYSQVDRVFIFSYPIVDGLMLLTKNRVYVFGDNHREALGCKLQKKSNKIQHQITRPREIEILRNKVIKAVSYYRHVFVLTEDGDLYGWGQNDYGVLGISKNRNFAVRPTYLVSNILKVSTYKHSLLINKTGEIFCFGSNTNCQVDTGFPSEEILDKTRKKIIDAVEVVCTKFHSFVLTKENKVYLWGQSGGSTVDTIADLSNCPKIKKMVPINCINDTKILALTEDNTFYFITNDKKDNIMDVFGPFTSATNVFSCRDNSWGYIDNNGYMFIYKYNLNTPGEKILGGTMSIPDANQLYQLEIIEQELIELSSEAKNIDFIKTLESFNNKSKSDFAFKLTSGYYFYVKKSILIQHNPSIRKWLLGKVFEWNKSSIKKCPRFHILYGFLIFSYTGTLRIPLHYFKELLELATFFEDQKLIDAINSRLQKKIPSIENKLNIKMKIN